MGKHLFKDLGVGSRNADHFVHDSILGVILGGGGPFLGGGGPETLEKQGRKKCVKQIAQEFAEKFAGNLPELHQT